MRLLLDAGADPNLAQDEGASPLCIIAEKGLPEFVTYHIQYIFLKFFKFLFARACRRRMFANEAIFELLHDYFSSSCMVIVQAPAQFYIAACPKFRFPLGF